MKASVLYKWLTYSAIAISILLCLFMLQAGLKGNFRSVDAFQAYIRGFGLFAPFVFVFIQAFQVVVPVLPGFIGCVAGALLFGRSPHNYKQIRIHCQKAKRRLDHRIFPCKTFWYPPGAGHVSIQKI